MRLGPHETVTVGVAAEASDALPAGHTVVRLCSTVDCFFTIGMNPTALNDSALLPAGVVEYFGIPEGGKVSVVRAGAEDGFLSVTAC